MARGQLTGKETLAQLLRKSASSDRRVRDEAQRALLQRPRAEIIAPLLEMLAEDHALRKNTALDLLAKLNAQEAVPQLVDTFNSTQAAGVRYYALLALDRLDATAVQPFLAAAVQQDADPDIRRMAAAMLGAMSGGENLEEASAAALAALRSGDRASAAGACDAVLRLKPDGAVPLLIDLLGSPHAGLQSKVAYTLARLGAGEALPRLREVLASSREAEVVAAAAAAIEMLGGPDDGPRLVAALERMSRYGDALGQHPARWMMCDMARWRIVLALRALPTPDAPAAVLPILAEPDERLRRAAYDTVLQFGDASTLMALDKLIGETEDKLAANRVAKLRRELAKRLA